MTYKPNQQLNKLREMIADVDCDEKELNARFWCFKNDEIFLYTEPYDDIAVKFKIHKDKKFFMGGDNWETIFSRENYTKSLDALYECIPDGWVIDIHQYCDGFDVCVSKRILNSGRSSIRHTSLYRALMDAVAQAIDYDRFMKENNLNKENILKVVNNDNLDLIALDQSLKKADLIDEMVETIGFYANYTVYPNSELTVDIVKDKGKRAKQALQKYEAIGGCE